MGGYAIINVLMLKQKVRNLLHIKSVPGAIAVGALLVVSLVYGGHLYADQFDEQIKQLQQEKAVSQQAADRFKVQANSYRDAVDKLQIQIDGTNQAILDNQRQSDEVQNQLVEAQANLDKQKKILGENIRTMYLEGEISTLEILASSNNLSDFVDKQQYRNAVQNKVKSTVDKINELKVQLQEKQRSLTALIKEKQYQKDQLDANQNEQSQLLAYTAGQKAQYDAQVKQTSSRINELRRQQSAAYARLIGSGGRSPVGSSITYKNMEVSNCGGGYRYCGYGLDAWVSDAWGLGYARECVHYVADALTRRGYYIPAGLFGGRGNANQWANTIRGVATIDDNPTPGSVVYMPIGPLGHVAMVESYPEDGWIKVSQMNFPSGRYSEMDLKVTSNLQFYHFSQ